MFHSSAIVQRNVFSVILLVFVRPSILLGLQGSKWSGVSIYVFLSTQTTRGYWHSRSTEVTDVIHPIVQNWLRYFPSESRWQMARLGCCWRPATCRKLWSVPSLPRVASMSMMWVPVHYARLRCSLIWAQCTNLTSHFNRAVAALSNRTTRKVSIHVARASQPSRCIQQAVTLLLLARESSATLRTSSRKRQQTEPQLWTAQTRGIVTTFQKTKPDNSPASI